MPALPQSLRIACGAVELRLLSLRHCNQLYELARDATLTRYLSWNAHRSISDSLTYVRDTQRLWRSRTAFLLGTFERAGGRLIGCTGINTIDESHQRAEMGSWIGVPYQGKGFNRPAKGAVCTLGFQLLKLEQLELLVRPDNLQSVRAARALPNVTEHGIRVGAIAVHGDAHDAIVFTLDRDTFDPATYPPIEVHGAPFGAPVPPTTD